MADYDAGEVTERERLVAERQKEVARFNRDAVNNQLARQMAAYDAADKQNAQLRDVQLKQTSRKNETDRFEAQRDLQNAALGLLGSMGNQALNSSATGNVMSMLANRNDKENNTYWQQLMDNQNAINNAYNESINQNRIARMDAQANAEKAIRDIEADLSANLANINPNLYVSPGTGDVRLYSETPINNYSVSPNMAQLSGYVTPANAEQNIRGKRNTLQGNDYYSQLINRFNGR